MAVLCFWAWGGVSTLAPGHIGWVMHGLDTPSQYLGWEFFRYTPWQWPPGLNPAYGADAPGSIVFADSIPLLALPLKLFSAWLPVDFQYFGLWAFSCFLLQAWFAFNLIRRVSHDPIIQLAGTAFFLSASIFLMRVYLQPSLAAQWALLAGFYLALDRNFRSRAWPFLLCITVLVHAYLFVMVAAIWCADMGQRLWRREKGWVGLVVHAAVSTILVLCLMWLAGYFASLSTGKLAVKTQTYTDLSFPFWAGPFWAGTWHGVWSWFIPGNKIGVGPSGGFGYFGLGFLFLCLLVVVSLFFKRDNKGALSKERSVLASTWTELILVCGIFFLYSLGPTIHYSGNALFSYPIPGWLQAVDEIFRGKGRMMWPMWYLILFGCIYLLSPKVRMPWKRSLIILALLIQLVDISKAFHHERASIAKRTEWHNAMESPGWQQYARVFDHVVFLQPKKVPAGFITFLQSYKSVAYFAARNRMTINIAYMARMDEKQYAVMRRRRIHHLKQGKAKAKTLYVVADTDLWSRLKCAHPGKLWYGRVDGLNLIARTRSLPAEKGGLCVR